MSVGTRAPMLTHPRRIGAGLRRSLPVLGWLLPAVVVIAFVIGYPVIQVIIDSFTSKTRFDPGEFVALENFRELMAGGDEELFWLSFRNNLVLLVSIPVTILVGLVVSSVLYRGIRGSRLYEVFIFLPFLPAVAAISVIFIYLLGWEGPLNESVRALSLEPLAQAWLTDPGLAIWSVLGVVTWKRLGFVVLLFMARMLSIDPDLLDAAAVDGATWSQAVRHVVVPEMRAIIRFVGILGFIEVFSFTFAYVFVLTRGGPFKNTYTLEYLLFSIMFRRKLVGLASAVAVLLLVLAIAVAVYQMRRARARVAT